jgi:hypothetical protein
MERNMQQLNTSGKELPNFKNLDAVDGTIYGRYNKVSSVNPHKCRFVATYPDGSIIKGIDLFTTGWDSIPNGLSELRYELSTGHVIKIPKYKAYLPMIEVSVGVDGSRIFHSINVNCLGEKEIIIYKIVLRQDNIAPQKIGDIIMSRQPLPKDKHSSWKYTS